MNTKYTRQQICEAIKYWQNKLNIITESKLLGNLHVDEGFQQSAKLPDYYLQYILVTSEDNKKWQVQTQQLEKSYTNKIDNSIIEELQNYLRSNKKYFYKIFVNVYKCDYSNNIKEIANGSIFPSNKQTYDAGPIG